MSKEPNLATLHELQTVYDTSDLYNFLEMLDAKEALQDIAEKKAKARVETERAKKSPQERRQR